MAVKDPTLGEMVDMLYDVDQQRLKLQRELKQLDSKQAAMEAYLIDHFTLNKLEGAMGHIGKMSVKPEPVPTVDAKNWKSVFKWIAVNDAWDMLYHRLNTKAVRERWDAKVQIPYVDRFIKKKISLTRR
jgi:hypothetical protein